MTLFSYSTIRLRGTAHYARRGQRNQHFEVSAHQADNSTEFPATERRIQTHLLGRVFDDTTTSYKLFWFKALLETLKLRWSSKPGVVYEPILVSDLVLEMVVLAWHPVCFFRLSLGATDKLQNACETLQKRLDLAPNTKGQQVRNVIAATHEILEHLWNLATYVPAFFLTPWFSGEMYGIGAGTARVKRAIQLARERRNRQESPPYWLDGKGRNVTLRIDRRWGDFLYENLGMLEAFSDRHLAHYLQARNPNSPGIIHKLREPPSPQLLRARRFWKSVREVFILRGISTFFQDIYKAERLDADFSIDHFLPWSFVAHDQLWNLGAPPIGVESIQYTLIQCFNPGVDCRFDFLPSVRPEGFPHRTVP